MREKLIELLAHDDCPMFMVFGDNLEGLADYLIANDVVPVVRCKDCKYRIEPSASSTKIACTEGVIWRAVEQNHFCSCGERKDNE